MKKRTHGGRGATTATAEGPNPADEIDLDRIVWDPEYRRAIMPLLSSAERPARKPRATRRRRGD